MRTHELYSRYAAVRRALGQLPASRHRVRNPYSHRLASHNTVAASTVSSNSPVWSALCATLLLSAQWLTAVAQTDEDLRRTIEKISTIADNIVVDGEAGDWEGILIMTDSPVDGRGGAHRDIVAVAIAPRANDILILIETDEPPSTTPNEFVVNIDLLGDPGHDFLLGIGINGASTISIFDGRIRNDYHDAPKVEAAIGKVVEARLPYATLRALMPLEMRRKFAGANARTWMRALPMAWDSTRKRYVDTGPAIASFRLEPLANLDSPLARTANSPAVMPPPFRGRWFIPQGAFGEHTHEDQWSYDFEVVNGRLFSAPRGVSRKNEDHFSWDKPVIAPVTAGVIRAKNDAKDVPPYQHPDPDTPVNGTYLKLSDDTALWLGHFREGSVKVGAGEVVSRGAELGRVGNSGYSNRPHLHITAYQLPSGSRTKPIAFSNVIVSLNPIPNDPWARRLNRWILREGLFVEGY